MSKTAFAKGNQLFRENKLEEAIKEYKKSIKQKETYFAYENLGMAFEKLKKRKDAEKAYKAGLTLNEKAARARKFINKKIDSDKIKNTHPVELIKEASAAIDVEPLKKEYFDKGLDRVEDTFCLVRIIGNDLYPRHEIGQTRKNIKFILDNEPNYDGLSKLWVVNRIIDKDERSEVLRMLKEYNQDYVEIIFSVGDYKKIPFDTEIMPKVGYLGSKEYQEITSLQYDRVVTATYRLKNNYVMNNNGARNVALEEAKKRAKWALPWDGNCYLTPDAWRAIQKDVTGAPWYSHFVVPMARMLSNDDLINNATPPDPVEEPQLIFRNDTEEKFNEDYCYGRRPKVEFFWAIGIPGKWDNWKDDPWDLPRRGQVKEASRFAVAGWVARLYSGMSNLEQNTIESFKNRGRIRQDAIISTLRHLDKCLTKDTAEPSVCQFYDFKSLDNIKNMFNAEENLQIKEYVTKIVKDADEALTRGPYSVIDKSTLPPSGDKQDYWHPAPYWWPDPEKEDGLPYIKKDGIRVPGTRMYEPESDKYDRTRLQRVFDNSISLALAWYFTEEDKYLNHAEKIFVRFFVNKSTRMNPHLDYAQVRMGHNNNIGTNFGIIEFKDLYYYLDALRIVEASGKVDKKNFEEFRGWLNQYQQWLINSDQGKKELAGKNNHGTYYDLHLAAVSAYLGDENTLFETLARAQGRIEQQITPSGEQPDELSRPTSQHYCHYNLQGFLNIALLAKNWGVDLFGYVATNGASLKAATDWLLERFGKSWQYQQIDEFDTQRSYPIFFYARALGRSPDVPHADSLDIDPFLIRPRFFPHDGILPYWQLVTLTHTASDTHSQAQGECVSDGADTGKPFAEKLDEVVGIKMASEAQKPLLKKQKAELVCEAIHQQELTGKQLYRVLEICVQLNKFDSGLAVLHANRESLNRTDYEKCDFALKVLSGKVFEHGELRELQCVDWWQQDGKVLGRDLGLLKAMVTEGELVKDSRALLDYVVYGGDAEALAGYIETVLRARGEPLEHVAFYLDVVHHLHRCSADKSLKTSSLRSVLPAIENIDLCFVGGFGWSGSGAAFDMLREARSDRLVFVAQELNLFESQFGMVKVLSGQEISETAVARWWLDAVFGFPCASKDKQLQKFFSRSLPAVIAYNKEKLKEISALFQACNPFSGVNEAEEFTSMGFDFIAGSYAIIQPGCEKVVFNNCIHGKNASLVAAGGANIRMLGVSRDIRDAYISRVYDKTATSTPEAYAKIKRGYIKKYADFEAVRRTCERVEEVAFEALVTDQKARQKVVDFFGMDDIVFDNGTKFFPEDSAKNIGLYKHHTTFNLSKI